MILAKWIKPHGEPVDAIKPEAKRGDKQEAENYQAQYRCFLQGPYCCHYLGSHSSMTPSWCLRAALPQRNILEQAAVVAQPREGPFRDPMSRQYLEAPAREHLLDVDIPFLLYPPICHSLAHACRTFSGVGPSSS